MIVIQGPSSSAILTTLQSKLQTIEDWCKEHRLEISKDKLALMPMFIRKREEYKRHPTIVAWGINVVSKMRYLGIILDCKLDWYPHTHSIWKTSYCFSVDKKNQLDVTFCILYFSSNICSTCFGQPCARNMLSNY